MAVFQCARQHVNEFAPAVLEVRICDSVIRQGDEIRFDGRLLVERMANQKVVEVPGLGAAAADAHAGFRLDERANRLLFWFTKKMTH